MFEVMLAYFDLFHPVNQRFFHFQIFRSDYIGLDGYNTKAKIYRAKKLKMKKALINREKEVKISERDFKHQSDHNHLIIYL
jgi:hypothetical protein